MWQFVFISLLSNNFQLFDNEFFISTENYRLQSKYENHLIAKVTIFQFVNSFLSLFYIAFYLRDQDKLKEQLAGLLISRQIIGNLRESAFPYFMEQLKLAKLSFNLWGALSPTQEFAKSVPSDVPTQVYFPLQMLIVSKIRFFSRKYLTIKKKQRNHLGLRREVLDKLKQKALYTNMMERFPIIWKCWFKWDTLSYFQLLFRQPVYVLQLIICQKFGLTHLNWLMCIRYYVNDFVENLATKLYFFKATIWPTSC